MKRRSVAASQAVKVAEKRLPLHRRSSAAAKKAVAVAEKAHQTASTKHREAVYKRTRTNKHKKHAANNLKVVGYVTVD